MSGIWKALGLVFAKIGQGALTAAAWSSTHPQVLTAINVAIAAVNPAAGAIAAAAGTAITTAESAKKSAPASAGR